MTMTGPMPFEDFELCKQHLLNAARLIAPNADVKREFVANLNDLEDEGKWSRRQIIYALSEAITFWAEHGVDHEIRPVPRQRETAA